MIKNVLAKSFDIQIIRNVLANRCSVFKKCIKSDARQTLKEFMSVIINPMKTKNYCLNFILGIRNMQRRWIKHLKIKKDAVENLLEQWNSELMRLVSEKDKYNSMGIYYNLDNLKYISTEVKKDICIHLVDRQILVYCDEKYAILEKEQDKKAQKNKDLFELVEENEDLSSDISCEEKSYKSTPKEKNVVERIVEDIIEVKDIKGKAKNKVKEAKGIYFFLFFKDLDENEKEDENEDENEISKM